VKKFLLPLGIAASACLLLVAIAASDEPEPDLDSPAHMAVVDALVKQSLQVADEADPLRRARGSSQVADRLADAVARATARGDKVEALKLTNYLSMVLDRGVSKNVAALDPEQMDETRFAEWQALSWQPEAICATLDRRLQGLGRQGAEEVKRAVAQASRAADKRWKKDKPKEGKFKGKGKGKKKDHEGNDGHPKKDRKGKKDQASRERQLLQEYVSHQRSAASWRKMKGGDLTCVWNKQDWLLIADG
jgi:hypothetical protein